MQPTELCLSQSSAEISGILELGNVWVFVWLIFGHHWPKSAEQKPKYCLTQGFLIPLHDLVIGDHILVTISVG